MSYLNDYLRVLPVVDANVIQQAIEKNEAILSVNGLSVDEFSRMIERLAKNEALATTMPELDEKILAEQLNQFYSHTQMDLTHLFLEQTQLEIAAENYEQIYRGQLQELRSEIETLERQILLLEKQQVGETGVLTEQYSFEPEKRANYSETHNDATAYLYCDRDGTLLNQASENRYYHTYYLSLSSNETVNALRDEKGFTTAEIEVIYESPETLAGQNELYGAEKAIDGNANTFWFNTAIKSSNEMDSVSITPKGLS